MRAHFGLPSVDGEVIEGKPPIQVKFEIPYFTTSGIQVCLTILICVNNTVWFLSSDKVLGCKNQ